MTQFKKGDRVRNKATGEIDVVKSVPGMRAYDDKEFADPERGMVLEKFLWEYQDEWELVAPKANRERATKITSGPRATDAWAGYRDGTLLWFCTDRKYAEKRAELFRHQLIKVRITPV